MLFKITSHCIYIRVCKKPALPRFFVSYNLVSRHRIIFNKIIHIYTPESSHAWISLDET